MRLFFKFLFLIIHNWWIKMWLISEYQIFIQILYWIYLSVLVVFLEKSLGFFIYSIIPSANNDNFTSIFPNWVPFISPSSLIAMARTFITMLNKSGESGHSFLFLCKEKSSSYSPLSMISSVYVIMVFIMLRWLRYSYFIEGFCHKWILSFVKAISAPIDIIISLLSFILFMSCISVIDLLTLKLLRFPFDHGGWSF